MKAKLTAAATADSVVIGTKTPLTSAHIRGACYGPSGLSKVMTVLQIARSSIRQCISASPHAHYRGGGQVPKMSLLSELTLVSGVDPLVVSKQVL